jgi:hypothetical protein
MMELSEIIAPPPKGNSVRVRLDKASDGQVSVHATYLPSGKTWKRNKAFRQSVGGWDRLVFDIPEDEYWGLDAILRTFGPVEIDVSPSKYDTSVLAAFHVLGKYFMQFFEQVREEEVEQQQQPTRPARRTGTMPPDVLAKLPRPVLIELGKVYGVKIGRVTRSRIEQIAVNMSMPHCFDGLPDDIVRQLLFANGQSTAADISRTDLLKLARSTQWVTS